MFAHLRCMGSIVWLHVVTYQIKVCLLLFTIALSLSTSVRFLSISILFFLADERFDGDWRASLSARIINITNFSPWRRRGNVEMASCDKERAHESRSSLLPGKWQLYDNSVCCNTKAIIVHKYLWSWLPFSQRLSTNTQAGYEVS